MNLLFFSRRLGGTRCIRLGRAGMALVALLLFVAIPVSALYGGYHLGVEAQRASPDALAVAWKQELDKQQQEIAEAKREASENLNALALRLGQMQAHVIRLDALGQRLTRMAGLDKGEFDFESQPAQGGPEDTSGASEPMAIPDFVTMLDELEKQLSDRGQQLGVLESMLMNINLQAEVFPAGRPIKKGWLSSPFGMRTDPFTGKREHHKGIDFAGKEGSEIIAVASGVVTWAGDRWGYGRLVEINHGNGYFTRYGHNKEILVEAGDTVKKGQVISLMGSTGRSTGPHVHFEVMRGGRAVDPRQYIQASR